jgi:hypothetical protein
MIMTAASPHSYIVVFGDLNYRLDAAYEEVHDAIARGAAHELLAKDQLAKSMGGVFSGYTEAAIAFPPTFKYDPGTSNYDTSAKRRTPAWTDRILVKVL